MVYFGNNSMLVYDEFTLFDCCILFHLQYDIIDYIAFYYGGQIPRSIVVYEDVLICNFVLSV